MGNNLESRWDSTFKEISNALTVLMSNRFFFREFQKIRENNPKLNVNNHFFNWIWEDYIYSASMGVRRLVDRDPKTNSLYILLKEIKNNPEILSRERYISIFVMDSGFSREEASMFFDRLVGEGKQHVDPTRVQGDIDILFEKYGKLKNYINKIIAHAERKAQAKMEKPEDLPTIGDLDDCIDYLEKLLIEYYAIFYAGTYTTLLPTIQYPWKDIFKFPWIAE